MGGDETMAERLLYIVLLGVPIDTPSEKGHVMISLN